MENKKILIVDDDANICKTLSDILKLKKYDVFSAYNGNQGLDVLRQSFINLVIIDLGLPDMSGLDLLTKIKENNSATEAIILTGNSSINAAIEATNRGAFSFLLKPYDMEQMLLLIRRALEKQEIAENLRKSEKRYRLIAENAHDMIWTLDLAGHLTYVSPSVEQLRGFAPQEALRQSLSEAMPTASAEIIMAEIKEIIEKSRTGKKTNSRVVEVEYICKDGRRIWMEANTSGLYDDSGRLLGLLGASRDISKRKKAQAERDKLIVELQEAIEKIKTLTGLLPICSYCKKIRGSKGNWQQMEVYISNHSEADFSHSICPECLQKHYPEFSDLDEED